METKKTVFAAKVPPEIGRAPRGKRDEDFRVFWRYTVIRLLCILGIHWEGIVVCGHLGCCSLCGEDTYAVFIVHKLERNAHGRILPRY